MKKLVFASSNQDKLVELQEILCDLNAPILSATEVGIDAGQIVETGTTFSENARQKAIFIGQKTKHLTLADDSGLMVDLLQGEPGIFSARYEVDDQKRITKVLSKLSGVPYPKRTAHFICAICLYHPATKKTHEVVGQADGYIVDRPIGSNGFGYDPIFFSPELGKTFGQATLAEKNFASHRRRALEAIKPILIKLLKVKSK